MALPVRRMSSSTFPRARVSFSACGAVEVSHHSFAGRTGWLRSSRVTRPCCCAYAKGHNFVSALAEFFKAGLDDVLGRITPGLRILLDMTPRQSIDKRVRRAGLSENFSGINLEHKTLAGSCPTVETEAQHCRI